ncbi:MAG: hypothetical protein V4517_10960 [Pseudomonadota bacterium]
MTGLAGLVVLIVLSLMFYLLTQLVPHGDSSLPLVAIGGVIVLVLLLTAVATMFSILSLTNNTQALGLPEGSIRAVIALSLIVLFAILSVFLYQNIGGTRVTIPDQTMAQLDAFSKTYPNARDIQAVRADKPGFYDISYRTPNPASDEFAKQLLVLLGTLMTAVTSFYLGAGTATSGVKAGSDAAGGPAASSPTLSGIKPPSYVLGSGSPLHLEIEGANLNDMKSVKIVKDGVEIVATNVKSSPDAVVCDLDLANATKGDWDVEVSDGGANSVKLSGGLTIM